MPNAWRLAGLIATAEQRYRESVNSAIPVKMLVGLWVHLEGKQTFHSLHQENRFSVHRQVREGLMFIVRVREGDGKCWRVINRRCFSVAQDEWNSWPIVRGLGRT